MSRSNPPIREILLATGNPGKAREMAEILGGSDTPVRWRGLADFAGRGWSEPQETADTFAGNAVIKALHYARLAGLWTIADDSGLEVDALGGEPGVRSARYAGEPKDDRANNALLVRRLADVPAERRTARFRCCVVLADPDGVLASAEGTVEGVIIDQPRGSGGFGYDPHFWIPPAGKTAAEMSPAEKHAVSHRGRALRRLHERLLALLAAPPR